MSFEKGNKYLHILSKNPNGKYISIDCEWDENRGGYYCSSGMCGERHQYAIL